MVDKGSDQGVEFVTVEVKGDKDPYKGPYTGKSNDRGDYTVVISELKDNVDGVEFEVKVVGDANVTSEDKHKWDAESDCHKEGGVQVMEVNWYWKPN